MPKQPEDRSKSVDELIHIGSGIAGGAAGAALGFFTGGPAGPVLGSVTGTVLAHAFRNVGSEIRHRVMSPRQEIRVGATFALAATKIRENIAQRAGRQEPDAHGRDPSSSSCKDERSRHGLHSLQSHGTA